MAIARRIEYAPLDDLALDPTNPRLGRFVADPNLPQSEVLDKMRSWALEELAVSFLESGFWPQEALLVVREPLYGVDRLVVVEGNRRLAALICLRDAYQGSPPTRAWAAMIKGESLPDNLFTEIPYLLADSRGEISAFLGFRHVTGIKEWDPAEKAEYITKLIDQEGLSYDDVRRRIGSKVEAVRRNYIAFRILLQLEEHGDFLLSTSIEQKFSVLFLSLREQGVQEFLSVDIRANPEEARVPVPEGSYQNLIDFATWLFGTEERAPIITDSRQVTLFAKVLQSNEALAYLKEAPEPRLDVAVQKSGADQPLVLASVRGATDQVEQALSRIHLFRDDSEIIQAMD